MLVRDIKSNWKSYTLDKGKTHLLYDKNPNSGNRTPHKYLCQIKKINRGWYQIINEGSKEIFWMVNKITDLKVQVATYVHSLPYSCEFYNPTYRKGYFEDMVIGNHLSKLGFDYGDHSWGSTFYELKRKDIYGGRRKELSLSIKGLDCYDEIPEEVTVSLWLDDGSWISSSCKRECSEMIKTIEGILKPLLLTNSIDDFNTQSKMNIENVDVYLNNIMNTLDTQSKDFKGELINTLEKTLETLKS